MKSATTYRVTAVLSVSTVIVLGIYAFWRTILKPYLKSNSGPVVIIFLAFAVIVAVGVVAWGGFMLYSIAHRHWIRSHTLYPNEHGDYPVRLARSTHNLVAIQPVPRVIHPPVPQTLTLHNHNDVKEWTKWMEMNRASVVETDSQLLLPGRCDFNDVLRSGFRPNPQQIFLGYLPGGDPVTSTLEGLCHVANAGATGGGKSSNIRMVCSQLLCDNVGADMMMLNPHHTAFDVKNDEDWSPIEEKLLKPPMVEYRDIAGWMKWAAVTELPRRLACWNKSKFWGNPLFLVIDELPAITEHIKEFAGWMADILREGRKVDLFIITAAQDFLVKTLKFDGGAVRDCFRTAIYVGGDATTARVLLDVKGTVDDGGLGKGVGMIRSSQVKLASQVRLPYTSNQALYTLLGPSRFSQQQIAEMKRAFAERRVVEADPVKTNRSYDALLSEFDSEELPTTNVSQFPAIKLVKPEPSYEDAVIAWNALDSDKRSRRNLQEALGCIENVARKHYDRIQTEIRQRSQVGG